MATVAKVWLVCKTTFIYSLRKVSTSVYVSITKFQWLYNDWNKQYLHYLYVHGYSFLYWRTFISLLSPSGFLTALQEDSASKDCKLDGLECPWNSVTLSGYFTESPMSHSCRFSGLLQTTESHLCSHQSLMSVKIKRCAAPWGKPPIIYYMHYSVILTDRIVCLMI